MKGNLGTFKGSTLLVLFSNADCEDRRHRWSLYKLRLDFCLHWKVLARHHTFNGFRLQWQCHLVHWRENKSSVSIFSVTFQYLIAGEEFVWNVNIICSQCGLHKFWDIIKLSVSKYVSEKMMPKLNNHCESNQFLFWIKSLRFNSWNHLNEESCTLEKYPSVFHREPRIE